MDTIQNSIQHSEHFLSDYQVIFWTLLVTVALAIIAVIQFVQSGRERKKLLHVFRGGKWYDSSELSYDQFREARPNSKYLHRQELERTILGKIADGQSVVLTGTPLRGKTRTLVECLRQLNHASVLIPYPSNYGADIVFPKKRTLRPKKKIIVFDDLQKFFEPDKNPVRLIDRIKEQNWLILASCRTVEEWETVKRAWGISSNILEAIEVPTVDENLGAQVAALNGISLPSHFDRKNIGTIFVDLDEMRLRYNSKTSTVQRQILVAIKKLTLAGICNYKGEIQLESVKLLTRRLPLTLSDSEWLDNVQAIIDKGFVSGTPFAVQPDQVLFDTVVEPQLPIPDIIEEVKEMLPGVHLNVNRLLYSADTPQEALHVIRVLQRAGIATNVYHYNIVMGKQDTQREGESLLKEMIEKRVAPDVVTYNMLMNLCEDFNAAGAIKEEMIRRRVTPDVFTYNTLINFCDDLDSAIALKKEMIQKHIAPDVITYTTLMKLCKDLSFAMTLKGEMSQKHIAPNVFTFNTLINLCEGLNTAVALKEEMSRENVAPNAFTFNLLINLCEDSRSAKALREEMIQKKIAPDVVTYTTLMKRCEDFGSAMALKEEMIEKKIAPNAFTYATLMKRCEDFSSAVALKEEMIQKGIAPNAVTYNILINLCEDFGSAIALKEEMAHKKIPPDVVTYGSLLEKALTEKDVYDWVVDFSSTELIPNTYIIHGFERIIPLVITSPRLVEMLALVLRFNPIMFFECLNMFSIDTAEQFTSQHRDEAVSSDFIKLGFANYYLQAEKLDTAKTYLDLCSIRNYYYYKYSGDYWRQNKNVDLAEDNYKNAVLFSETPSQRASIYYKLASLAREFMQEEKMGKAMEYCQQSILLQPDNSPEAKRLLAFLTIETTALDALLAKMEELRSNYHIGKKTIKLVLRDIGEKEKKNLVSNYFS